MFRITIQHHRQSDLQEGSGRTGQAKNKNARICKELHHIHRKVFPLRPDRCPHLWQLRYPLSPRDMVKKWYQAHRVALHQPTGLRQEILQRFPHHYGGTSYREAIVRAVNKFNEQDNATYKALMRATISEALGLNGEPEEVDMLERSGSCSIWQFPIKRIPSSKRCTKGGIFCLRGLEDGMLGGGRGGAKRKLCHKPMKIHFSSPNFITWNNHGSPVPTALPGSTVRDVPEQQGRTT